MPIVRCTLFSFLSVDVYIVIWAHRIIVVVFANIEDWENMRA